jgi:hypothetical protein
MESSTTSESQVAWAYVNADGTMAPGSNGIRGVVRTATGTYSVTFEALFPYLPAVCAHRVLTGEHQNTLRNCLLLNLTLGSVIVVTGNKEGHPVDSDFTFLAVGQLSLSSTT